MNRIILTTIITLFFILSSKGQSGTDIVNIPDANLKEYLINEFNVDSNDNGEIEYEEAWAKTKVEVSYPSKSIQDLTGIEAFKNSTQLVLKGQNIALSLSVPSEFTELKTLYIYDTSITSIHIGSLPASESNILIYYNNSLTNFTINSAPVDLSQFVFANNDVITDMSFMQKINPSNSLSITHNDAITSLDLSNVISVDSFTIQFNNALTNITGVNPQVTNLKFAQNALETLSLANLNQLTELDVRKNNLNALTLTNLNALNTLIAFENDLKTLDLSGAVNIEYLEVQNNDITQLDLSELTKLKELEANSNDLTEINLIYNPNIEKIYVTHNNITRAFLRNGTSMPFDGFNTFALSSNPIEYICGNDDEILQLKDKFPDAEVNTYCSFEPIQENYLEFKGTVKFDAQDNGCSSGAQAIPSFRFSLNNNIVYSNPVGVYRFYLLENGTYTLIPNIDTQLFTSNPLSVEETYVEGTKTIKETNFCISKNAEDKKDVGVIVSTRDRIRPGFSSDFRMAVSNYGNLPVTIPVKFTYNESQFNYLNSSYNGVSGASNAGLVSWEDIYILPYETHYFDIELEAHKPTDPEPLNGGEDVNVGGEAPLDDDDNPENNNHNANLPVVNSFDPNDIMCMEGTTLPLEKIGKKLTYRIRFENKGSAEAVNIVVKNYINPAMFDISSLQPISSSHDYELKVNGDTLEFIFENINLPFDDATNDGDIFYQINTLDTLVEGSTIENQADIYFDFNFPIITNNEVSEFKEEPTASVNTFNTVDDLILYPNPTKDRMSIKVVNHLPVRKVSIFDITGKEVFNKQYSNSSTTTIDVSSLSKGIYLVKTTIENDIITKKLIIK